VKARRGLVPTAILLLGAIYSLLPIIWVATASTKPLKDLFTTFTFAPGGSLFSNLGELFTYRDGLFWHWVFNSVLYSGVGAAASTLVSAMAGFALAKYRFAGRSAIFNLLLAGVLVPAVTLAIPQYLMFAKAGLTDSYWSVLLPSIISPYGIYLCRIYAAAAVPDEIVEAARVDGASEQRIFQRVAAPMMMPGMVTVFLFQFVAIWNNFLLPFIMLSDDRRFPLTIGLYTLLNQGAAQPALYTLVVVGAFVSIIPLMVVFLVLQRYWRVDLFSGGLKG
jgi:multiple sugar transport system permease protein